MRIQRNDFFSGKFLKAEDMARDQSYLIGSKKSLAVPQSMFEANVSATIGALRAVNLKDSALVGVNGVEVQRKRNALVRDPASPIDESMNALQEQLKTLKDRRGDLQKEIMAMERDITDKQITAAEAAEKAENSNFAEDFWNELRSFFGDDPGASSATPDLSGDQQKMEELKGLLAQVDVEIKVVVQEIKNLKSVEDASHQTLSDAREPQTALNSNLQKAVDQYALVMQSVSLTS